MCYPELVGGKIKDRSYRIIIKWGLAHVSPQRVDVSKLKSTDRRLQGVIHITYNCQDTFGKRAMSTVHRADAGVIDLKVFATQMLQAVSIALFIPAKVWVGRK